MFLVLEVQNVFGLRIFFLDFYSFLLNFSLLLDLLKIRDYKELSSFMKASF